MNFPEVKMHLTLLGWTRKHRGSEHTGVNTEELWSKGSEYAFFQPGPEGGGDYINHYPNIGKAPKTKCLNLASLLWEIEHHDDQGA